MVADIIVLTIIAVICILIIRSVIKTKKNGGCSYGCSGCTGCSGCSSSEHILQTNSNRKRGEKDASDHSKG